MSKYTVNMSDQLMKVRVNTQEKLKKEAEVVVEIEQPSALQSATADYLSRKEEPHPLGSPKNLNEMKKVEIKLNRGNVDKDIQKIVKHIGLVNKKRRANQQIKITQNMSDDSVTLDGGKNVDIDREVADIRNFIGYKSAKVVESVQEETLDEAKFSDGMVDKLKKAYEPMKGKKINPTPLMKTFDKIDSNKDGLIQLYKADIPFVSMMAMSRLMLKHNYKASDINKLGKIRREDFVEEVNLDELAPAVVGLGRAALGIGRAGAKSFGKSAGTAAGGAVGGAIAKKINSSKEKSVRQLINPTKEVMVVKKNKVVVIDKKDQDKYMKQGWSLAEKLDKDDEDSVGDVVKQLKKSVKAHQKQANSLTKDMQDELQVKEWFKSKNIDVKVRELEESTQVYVPLGRRIPNEIREELITTQYGKMPEDVKNVKDINYGNFMENSITMNNDFWSKVLHGTKGE